MKVLAVGLVGLALAVMGCGASSEESKRDTTPRKKAAPEEAANSTTSDANSIPSEKFDEIDQFFHRKANQIQFTCYNAEVDKTNKKYEGNLTFSITVTPGGKAGAIKVTNSTLNSPGIEECAIKEMQGWEWPDVPANAPYTGSINFKPAW